MEKVTALVGTKSNYTLWDKGKTLVTALVGTVVEKVTALVGTKSNYTLWDKGKTLVTALVGTVVEKPRHYRTIWNALPHYLERSTALFGTVFFQKKHQHNY